MIYDLRIYDLRIYDLRIYDLWIYDLLFTAQRLFYRDLSLFGAKLVIKNEKSTAFLIKNCNFAVKLWIRPINRKS